MIYEPVLKNIPEKLTKILEPGDMLLVLGAGNVNRIIPDIIHLLERGKENGR